ncbi:MAG: DUF29 family protein [Gemmatimonadaceae bacterium]|nr:DUF29 family protein [Acetobacteraceae bacterium]
MSELYEADVFEWSQHQAALLRRRAAGELVNEADLDWPNIAKEIESVGSEQRHAVEGNLVQALIHDLKCDAWPLVSYVPQWRAEARTLRRNARRRFTNSMRGRIDLAVLYADALAGMPESIDGQPPLPVPEVCPVTLDELLGDGP